MKTKVKPNDLNLDEFKHTCIKSQGGKVGGGEGKNTDATVETPAEETESEEENRTDSEVDAKDLPIVRPHHINVKKGKDSGKNIEGTDKVRTDEEVDDSDTLFNSEGRNEPVESDDLLDNETTVSVQVTLRRTFSSRFSFTSPTPEVSIPVYSVCVLLGFLDLSRPSSTSVTRIWSPLPRRRIWEIAWCVYYIFL